MEARLRARGSWGVSRAPKNVLPVSKSPRPALSVQGSKNVKRALAL
jgi:hypothetical protein